MDPGLFVLFFVSFVLAFYDGYCSLGVICWERADLLALKCVMFLCFCLSHMVSWVRNGACLYRFLGLELQCLLKVKEDLSY